MRERKFRVWESRQKVMLYSGFSINEKGDVSFYWNEKPIHSAYAHLLEWTGLLDKNGKDIYEGDVLEVRILKCEMSNNGMDFENNRDFCAGHHIKKDRFVASMELDLDNSLIYPSEVQELPECFLPEEDAVPEEYKTLEEMKSDIGLIEIIGNVYEDIHLLNSK